MCLDEGVKDAKEVEGLRKGKRKQDQKDIRGD